MYETYEECLIHRRSKAQAHNKVRYKNLFQHFEPGQKIQADFLEFGSDNFKIMVNSISGFLKVCKTKTNLQARP